MVHGWESPTEQQRYLLDDGRLFFDSEDALLPQATNGQQNVYEYEPEGVGVRDRGRRRLSVSDLDGVQ